MLDHDFSLVFGTDPYSGGTPQPSGAAGTRIEHETKDSEEHHQGKYTCVRGAIDARETPSTER